MGNSYALKVRAIGECPIANTRYAIGNSYALKVRAIVECPIANTRYAIGYSYICKIFAVRKCKFSDIYYFFAILAFGNNYLCRAGIFVFYLYEITVCYYYINCTSNTVPSAL